MDRFIAFFSDKAVDIIAVVISAVALLLTLFQLISDKKRSKKEATLNAFNLIQNEVFDEIWSMKNIANMNRHGEEWNKLTKSLARIEHFCVGVNVGVYDVRVINRMGGSFIIGIYNKLKPAIEIKNEHSKTGKHFEEFEKTVRKIKLLRKRKK